AVQKEIAAVKGRVVAAVYHLDAILPVLAKHTAENVDGRQDAGPAAVAERQTVLVVVAQIGVDDLAFEYVAHHAAAVAAAALHRHVPQTEVVEIAVAVLAFERDTMTLPSFALDVEAFDHQEAHGGAADVFEDVATVGNRRDEPSAMRHDAMR